jgi:putative transposase
MGRPLRIKVPDVTYHITSRTNGKKLFLKKKRDQKTLCQLLKLSLLKHKITLYSYTPMMNHFHMLIRFDSGADLSKFMCEFKANYAKYFNRKYGTSGHFWGDRYRSTLVQDDQHALACLRYIDRNAVKAGLVPHPDQWLFNSFRCYAYGEAHPLLPLQPHPTYLGLAGSRPKRREIYLDFVMGEDKFSDALFGNLHRLQFFGSEAFMQKILEAN